MFYFNKRLFREKKGFPVLMKLSCSLSRVLSAQSSKKDWTSPIPDPSSSFSRGFFLSSASSASLFFSVSSLPQVSLSRVTGLKPLSSPALLPPLAPAFLSSLSVRLDAVSSMLLSFLEKETYVPLNPPMNAYSEKASDSWHVVFNLADVVFDTPAPVDW